MEEKIRVKKLGPNKPDPIITQQTKDKIKAKNWSFSRSVFECKLGLTGCGKANAVFCFPCIRNISITFTFETQIYLSLSYIQYLTCINSSDHTYSSLKN